MRLLTYDELTSPMEADRTLIHLASFGGTFPRRSIDLWRRRTRSLADYVGVFAEEWGRLLGQTFVLRIPYTFPSGTELVSGIAAVGTRPDRGRMGIARSILLEVLRREREAGIRFSTLWTNRSWGAHGLYEELGFRDVYSSPWAVHVPTRSAPRGSRLARPAGPKDLADIERLHARRAAGRLGFLREPNGYLSVARAAGDVQPAKELVTVRRAGRLVGYAHLESNPYRTICGELVATSRAARRTLVDEVQRRARTTPYAFQHTPVSDDLQLFRDQGYAIIPRGWYVLMASRFGRDWNSREAVAQFATNDRRFLCMSGDRY
jgi:GNAT superfamily N-acetyltransferase